MRSVKPGRGPSFLGGVGGIIAAVFGVLWTIMAYSMGAPVFFCLFGVLFIVLALVNAVYNLLNAGKRNRFSSFDITEEGEEEDPQNQRFGDRQERTQARSPDGETVFCPYCGERVEEGYRFCRRCGKELP